MSFIQRQIGGTASGRSYCDCSTCYGMEVSRKNVEKKMGAFVRSVIVVQLKVRHRDSTRKYLDGIVH